MIHLCRPLGPKATPVTQEPFIVGVNYWPRMMGVDLWKAFDVDAVHEDFATMADLGINYARVFLTWEDFQPDPESLRCATLAHLMELCDAAAAESIKLELVLFSGHIGHINQVPAWLVDSDSPRVSGFPTLARGRLVESGILNPFSNPLARRAAVRLVRGVARSVANHPAVVAYNLGNEPDLLAEARCTTEAHEWFAELRQAIGNVDSRHPVTCSLGGKNLARGDGLRVDHVFSNLDYCTIDREGMGLSVPADQREKLALFNCALTSELTQKKTVLQEWDSPVAGCSRTNAQHDREVADYAEALLPELANQGARGAILWWFADVEHKPLPCCENQLFGLLDSNGQLRPHGEVLREFARSKPKVALAPTKRILLGMTADDFYEHPMAHAEQLFRGFLDR